MEFATSSRDHGLVIATAVCHAVQFFREAAGVEPDISVENAQLIDSENARIGMISRIAKSTVRPLYSLFSELLELPKLHPQTAPHLRNEHSEVRL